MTPGLYVCNCAKRNGEGGQAQTGTGQVPEPRRAVNCFINAQNSDDLRAVPLINLGVGGGGWMATIFQWYHPPESCQ